MTNIDDSKQARRLSCVVACGPPTASPVLWLLGLGNHHPQGLFVGRREPPNATRGAATGMKLSNSWANIHIAGSLDRFSCALTARGGVKVAVAAAI